MPDLLVWHVGDREPSYQDTAEVDGVAQNLTGKTARFKMRAVGSTVLKVDQPVSNTPDSTGVLRYDWASLDTDTGGTYLAWFEVTGGGKPQTIAEAAIAIRAHAPLTNAYVELEEVKSTLSLSSTTHADLDIQKSIGAACQWIEGKCDRRFWRDPADVTRYYRPLSNGLVLIDDLTSPVTSIATDEGYAGTWSTTWTENTDFVFGPENAAADGWPYTSIETHPNGRYAFSDVPRNIKIVGRFGWPSVPVGVQEATMMLLHRYVKRKRESPFGVVGLGLDSGGIRLPRYDPDVENLIQRYVRYTVA